MLRNQNKNVFLKSEKALPRAITILSS